MRRGHAAGDPPIDPPPNIVERIERAAARVACRCPPRLQVLLSGEKPVVVDGLTLDPGVQLIRAVRRRRNPHHLSQPDPASARARFRRETLLFRGPPTPVAAVRDFEIPGDAGPIRVRHYAPEGAGPRPLTVYLHGGGWVIGDLDTHDEPCRILCREGATHVLSVEYRLAPEHPFPAALDDARAALGWGRAHAAELGADPARVGIGGDSAGGNLAAVVSLLARDEGEPSPAAQLLVYPATEAVREWPSYALFGEGFFLSNVDRTTFSGHYLEGTGVDRCDPRVSPLLAEDLSRLPPSLVVTAGYDVLRDEGEAYAEALRAAGTPVQLLRIPGHGHGFLHMTGVSPAARATVVQLAREWREVLEGPNPAHPTARANKFAATTAQSPPSRTRG